MKRSGNTKEGIEEKIDQYFINKPDIFTELKYLKKDKKKIDEMLDKNVFFLIIYKIINLMIVS